MKIKHILSVGSLFLVLACKEKPEPQARAEAQAAGKEVSIAPIYAPPDTFKAALGKVFDGYARIQSALAQDDLPKAKEAFSTMHAVLHMMPMEGLDPEAKAYWDSTDARIMTILHPMASADSLESVRRHFLDFSLVLSDAIQKFGMSGENILYQFHCPMAMDNKGADWLQKDSVLANPYFGSAMPECGERVRTIHSKINS